MRGVEKDRPGAAAPRKAAADPAGTGALNLRWAEAFAHALAEAGVTDAVVAPGSRSAPLALALHAAPLRTHIALDERAGAFFALGLAKASRRPAAVLCTSGTAAANFHPAILEARHARVPLIALTADRPPELRDAGAPQTVDQIKLYGDAVLWFCEVGAPEAGADLLRYVASLGARAAAAAWGPPAGPVHLNFAFREPLLPGAGEANAAARTPARETEPGPDPRDHEGPLPSARAVERCVRLLRARRRGLIVCGPDDDGAEAAGAVHALAEATGYPILADPLSGIRFGANDRARVLGAYDAFLRAPSFAAVEAPEAFVHFGAAPTSKALARYADRFPAAARIAVDPAGALRDPSRRAREVVRAAPAPFARALADALVRVAEPLPSWGTRFQAADRAAAGALAKGLARDGDTITEAGLFPALVPTLPEGSLLFAGNSMPVRDLDAFVPGDGGARALRVLGNRGVNGIDGVLSTALGASAAAGAPALVVLGDLSFHHDLNGLAALREGHARAVIVVVNNDGGGIFSMLPVAEHGEVFERYFGTPHGLDFEHAAALYGISYARPAGLAALAARAGEALRAGESLVLEVRSDRAAGAAHRRALLDAAVRAVEATP
ncbi:MAG TPA: 2-succinyl-5-enolpyruvyl-6-hydroxy-3-cyclohexene-1-carboxylic-acid synthase [Candidatus Omnitrophota bacterium]|nr:2-succinyl-5-enolpyruvyl-6-hydroxy-3-cyclohexene-1-carboxylic-acid synthase [Candidatus Omnitrophota bacterium]